eukprot:SAG11_NODE_11476_length_758_cov_1.485584_2_plen_63_part_01
MGGFGKTVSRGLLEDKLLGAGTVHVSSLVPMDGTDGKFLGGHIDPTVPLKVELRLEGKEVGIL